ncbi:MAG TPA: proline--tRNA ligase [Candidatus Limnocylindrales bacterium]|nr:proline--tRNA ligase [Candidatus Limnocylindrales bacterium]
MAKAGFVTSITRQSEDFPAWYNDVVRRAELADYSPVRGCMIIRPYGYAIWESMRDELDRHIKRTGHQNVYFPLFVPRSLLEKEAEHVEGFNPQVAWVTHAGGEELNEWLAIRPTSETLIAEVVKDWIQSYRDLPLLMNLWNNVVRWELRTRLFLRTTEFLWQEAHTFHATEQEAVDEVATGLEAYRSVAEDWLAIPVIKGRKTENEKFPGAVYTLAVEALMRDGKALQAGTSHMLGQNFARAANIEFLDRDNERKNPHGTSWGFSTRMVGATIMAHGDDSGLVLPPNVAPVQVVIVPIFRSDEDRTAVAGAIKPLEAALRDSRRTLPDGRTEPVRFQVDWREETPGFKYNHWELRGVPFRLEVGPRDVAAEQGMLVKRIDRSKEPVPLDRLAAELPDRLDAYQREIFGRAVAFRDDNTHRIDEYDDFKRVLDEQPGFVLAPWCGDSACEKQISTDTGATIRIVPLDQSDEPGACLRDGRPSRQPALFARAY